MSNKKHDISNPYTGEQYELFFPTKPDFMQVVRDIEETLGLKLMAEQEGDILDGFVSMIAESDGYHVIVSLYKVNKEPDEDSPYKFKKATLSTRQIASLNERFA